MLCVHVEGWDREGGRETQEGGDMGIYIYIYIYYIYIYICMYVCIADSLFYKAETNTLLQSNYTPIKMFKKK